MIEPHVGYGGSPIATVIALEGAAPAEKGFSMTKLPLCTGPQLELQAARAACTIQCPVCGTWVRVRKDGRMRVHRMANTSRGRFTPPT